MIHDGVSGGGGGSEDHSSERRRSRSRHRDESKPGSYTLEELHRKGRTAQSFIFDFIFQFF